MITPSFGLTATERVLPKLALDFTTASLDSRVTFTRSGNTATVVNSSGIIQLINANLPRFDYNPVTLACKGLLIEESRTNSLLASNDITNATYWNQSGAVPVANQTTSPDGTANADLLREDATNGRHDNYNGITLTAASYTYSQYVKPAGRTWVKLRLDVAGSFKGAYFDIANGTIGTVDSGYTAVISNAGNGWYRCSVTTTATAATWFSGIRLATGNGVDSYQGDNTSGVYTGGSQTEAGAFATSYIPTTTAALTRNADVATMTGTNFSDWYNQSSGTLFQQSIVLSTSGTKRLFNLSDGTDTNRIYLGAVSSGAFTVVNASSFEASLSAGTVTANTMFKTTGTYNTNYAIMATNATLSSSDTSVTLPTLSQANLGSNGNATSFMNGWLQKVSYWPMQLTSAEVRAFSK